MGSHASSYLGIIFCQYKKAYTSKTVQITAEGVVGMGTEEGSSSCLEIWGSSKHLGFPQISLLHLYLLSAHTRPQIKVSIFCFHNSQTIQNQGQDRKRPFWGGHREEPGFLKQEDSNWRSHIVTLPLLLMALSCQALCPGDLNPLRKALHSLFTSLKVMS